MYSDLPAHLQTLNALPSSSSPPSSALSAEQEEAFWSFMNTDELFANFGVPPSAFESKLDKEAAAAAPAVEEKPVVAEDKPAATLESFLATFADEAAAPAALSNNLFLSQLSSSFASSSTAVKPAEVLPAHDEDGTPAPETPSGDRITGAKRLKQLGAGQAEIEEDKRRRNTEASARFRLKKKQREQNLESRAKDLEAQVAALIADKASLEKENNLLKFIIVQGNGATPSSTAGAGTQPTAEGLQSVLAALGKRKRVSAE